MIDIDKILKLENINNYILALDVSDRINVLKDDRVRNYYLEDYNYNDFVLLVSNLSENELLNFIDNNMINKILTSNQYTRIIGQLIRLIPLGLPVNKIFENEKLMNVIIHDKHLKYLLEYLSGSITETLFNMIIENNELESINYLNKEDFCKLLEREDIINKIKLIDDNGIINKLPTKALTKLLIDPYFKSKLLNMKIEDIDFFIRDGLVLPNNFINDNSFISKYIDVPSIPIRRIYIKALMMNNYSLYEEINGTLNEMYDNNAFDELKKEYCTVTRSSDNVELKKQIQNLYSSRYLQILIDRYFEDFDGNILTNIYTILDFNKKYNIILQDRVKYYELLKDFNSYDMDTQKQIYSMIPKEISTWLYEDFRSCQNKAYTLINDEIVDISKLKVNEMDNICVYELNGEDFILPVHAMVNRRCEDDIKWSSTKKVKTLCITLIGSENLGTYREPDEYLVVGFKKLNISDIMHVYHSDSFSSYDRSTDRVNEICTPHELLLRTQGYNEILISQQNLNSLLTPDYVVCYDEVTQNDIRCAKKLGNIPIIKINTRCYNIHRGSIDYCENNYVKSVNDLYSYESAKSMK